MSEVDIDELVNRLRWMPGSLESKAADSIDYLRQQLAYAEHSYKTIAQNALDEANELRQKLEAAEARAEKAELDLDACQREKNIAFKAIREAREQKPVAYGIPNSRPTENQPMMTLHHQRCGQYPEMMIPLYAAQVPAMPIQDDKWQPIETAPKDGKTCFLAYCISNRAIYTLYWQDDFICAWRDFILVEEFTHWMPMPSAPKSEVKPS